MNKVGMFSYGDSGNQNTFPSSLLRNYFRVLIGPGQEVRGPRIECKDRKL